MAHTSTFMTRKECAKLALVTTKQSAEKFTNTDNSSDPVRRSGWLAGQHKWMNSLLFETLVSAAVRFSLTNFDLRLIAGRVDCTVIQLMRTPMMSLFSTVPIWQMWMRRKLPSTSLVSGVRNFLSTADNYLVAVDNSTDAVKNDDIVSPQHVLLSDGYFFYAIRQRCLSSNLLVDIYDPSQKMKHLKRVQVLLMRSLTFFVVVVSCFLY